MNHYGKAGQTTVSCLFIPIRITKIKKTIAGTSKEVKKLEPGCIADGNVKIMVSCFGKHLGSFLKY